MLGGVLRRRGPGRFDRTPNLCSPWMTQIRYYAVALFSSLCSLYIRFIEAVGHKGCMPVWRIVTKQESERVSRVLGGLVGGLTAGCWNTIERS